MATDIGTLEKRYFDACKGKESYQIRQSWQHYSRSFYSFNWCKAKIKKGRHEISTLMVSMDDLKDVDLYPLLDLLKEIDSSEIDAVDIVNRSSCVLSGEHVSAVLRAVNKKLRVVDICDISFGKDFLLISLNEA
ncbi:hypothetical protein Sango_0913100 [Sesamum angolense]|uniref:DWD hypersensitive to UV-B 1 N-terminal domain-containing protein n=1 Tax=Sesamum angolense TaxID=2727404 RepID=A0AAE1WXW5_9LAMI|nr:hypothetical protein Sango_0913100 [Sesamum angolense]